MVKVIRKYHPKALLYLLLKFIAIILILTTGCAEKKEKIIVWSSMRPVERNLLDSLLNSFSTSYPQFEFSQLFYAPEEARTNFIISALAGKGPAILHGASDNMGPLVELDVIQPLDTLFETTYLDRFLNHPIQANTWLNGQLYQIADRIGNHLCLVYNKDLINLPPGSFDELIEVGKKLTTDKDNDGKPDSYALAWNYTEPFFAIPFIGGYGGWIFDENYKPTLNSSATVKAAQLIYDLANVHKIIPTECDYEVANALFKEELTAMIINGPWSWGTYIKAGLNIGLAKIPMIDETGLWPTPLVSPMGFSINKNISAEKLKVSVELIKYLTQADIELEFTKISGSIPSVVAAYEDSLVTDDPFIQNAIDQLLVGKSMPVITEMRWIFDAMRPAYQSIFTGRLTPEQAAEDMQALAEKLIKENRE